MRRIKTRRERGYDHAPDGTPSPWDITEVDTQDYRLMLAVVRAVDALGACGLSPILQDADKVDRLWSALDAFNAGGKRKP